MMLYLYLGVIGVDTEPITFVSLLIVDTNSLLDKNALIVFKPPPINYNYACLTIQI